MRFSMCCTASGTVLVLFYHNMNKGQHNRFHRDWGQTANPTREPGRYKKGCFKMLEMILASFIVGLLVAIPPGTVTVIAAQKSILYGFRNSLFFTFGSCISDVFYIIVVFFGISPLFENHALLKVLFWYFSSILLLYFGYDAFRAFKERTAFSYTQANHKSMFNNIISGVLVTLSKIG